MKGQTQQPTTDKRTFRSCGLCRDGWLGVAQELPATGFTLEEYLTAYAFDMPCDCEAGNHLWHNAVCNKRHGEPVRYTQLHQSVIVQLCEYRRKGKEQRKAFMRMKE